jgi:uncharacterized protein (TIGR04255 family)
VVTSPLVEAIFEIRWELQTKPNRPPFDSNFKIFIGRFFERAVKEYPQHIPLPPANMPDEMSAYLIQHQFRIKRDKWPLIQMGQGIVTLNDTESYSWPDFKMRSQNLVKMLFDSYPDSKKLKINNVILKYINAVKFDFARNDPNNFLQRLHCNFSMNDNFFDITNANKKTESFNLAVIHSINNPKGNLTIRYGRGISNKNDAIVWEMGVQSGNGDAPKKEDEIKGWIESAHEIPHKWYNSIKDRLD